MTPSNFIVGIDMDDTIENLVEAWTAWLNKKYGYSLTAEDITQWDLGEFYTGLTRDQIFEPLNQNVFWKTVKVKPDAVKYIKKLIDDGFDVRICTNSNYHTLETKINEVLLANFPFIDRHKIIITADKSICKFDVLVDDYWKNLETGAYYGLLYDTPHNRSYIISGYGMARVHGWEDAYQAIWNLYEDAKEMHEELL